MKEFNDIHFGLTIPNGDDFYHERMKVTVLRDSRFEEFHIKRRQMFVTIRFLVGSKTKHIVSKIRVDPEANIENLITKSKCIIKTRKLLDNMSKFEDTPFGLTLPSSDDFLLGTDQIKTIIPSTHNILHMKRRLWFVSICFLVGSKTKDITCKIRIDRRGWPLV
eukprot:TRINITY_DN1295_c1_g1_i1.p1 TRINITY_DN1295_c1_g1~~TRINITY_DN1295_c1_g1_i1.p1  ORF type:complete len:164 (-),score=15.51 TRINITY_DN1295_c1_g1_i1:9-500(-)